VADEDGGARSMALSQAVAAPIEEILGSVELIPRNEFHLEPRCRVCRNDEIRTKVNEMLAAGPSYAFIVRALGEHNANCDKRDLVSIDSVRTHAARHYPVQNVAGATYRDILEQRAQENRVDFVAGVATALTPLAFYETVMVKGYEALVDSNTKVDVNTGMIAAGRLQSLIESRASGTSMADMLVQINRIINAVKSTVPETMWPEIVRKMKGEDEAAQPLAEDADVFGPNDDPFDDELDELDDLDD
jgi:hypothetical protein